MDALTAVATILGGLAALWFFHEKYGERIWPAVRSTFSPLQWERVRYQKHYIVWDGPLDMVSEKGEEPWTGEHIKALRNGTRFKLQYAMPFRVSEYEAEGYKKIYESDCKNWKKELIDREQFTMMIKADTTVLGRGPAQNRAFGRDREISGMPNQPF